MRTLNRLLIVLLLSGLLGLTTGCADSGGGSSADAATGSVAVALTDAPTDEFIQVLVTVLRIDRLPGLGLLLDGACHPGLRAEFSAGPDSAGRSVVDDGPLASLTDSR